MLSASAPVAFVPGLHSVAPSHKPVPRCAQKAPQNPSFGFPSVLCAVASAAAVKRLGKQCRGRIALGQGASVPEKFENEDDLDNLLMQAGLRNVLGVEEKKIAEKLNEVCQMSDDMQRCLKDVEVKNKILVEELSELREKLGISAGEKNTLEAEVAKLTEELAEAKAQIKHLQAAAGDHWAEKKIVQDARDDALCKLSVCQQKAEAEARAGEERLRSAHAQIRIAEAEAKTAKAELQALKAAGPS